MTIIIEPSPLIGAEEKTIHVESEKELVLDGGFAVPETNAFGHNFRDYTVESARQQGVENFYKINHLNQTYDYVRQMRDEYAKLDKAEMNLGKVLLLPSFGELPQWAVVGDTYPVGCAFHDSIVHSMYFKENPDYNNPAYNSKYGVYSDSCKENGTTLPSAGLFIIRYHSFYALHKSGAYKELMNKEDEENLKWLHIFK
ncbi:hypothetical protein HAX54_045360 [Datura stramonium]|uniref:Inositol oxygenase n=1 Tax=Datura stramonium TaxID=4076 RepID=A0ABS8WJJ9_DATST|nr:hypothetical protein [Datura stramonium]